MGSCCLCASFPVILERKTVCPPCTWCEPDESKTEHNSWPAKLHTMASYSSSHGVHHKGINNSFLDALFAGSIQVPLGLSFGIDALHCSGRNTKYVGNFVGHITLLLFRQYCILCALKCWRAFAMNIWAWLLRGFPAVVCLRRLSVLRHG